VCRHTNTRIEPHVLPSLRFPGRSDAIVRAQTTDIGEMLTPKEKLASACGSDQHLLSGAAGIEPELLPGRMHSERRFHSVSFRFGPVRYVRIRFRVLTASRGFDREGSDRDAARGLQSPNDVRELRLWVNAV